MFVRIYLLSAKGRAEIDRVAVEKEQSFLIALDQGTTSSRAVLYDLSGRECRVAQRKLSVHFPENGWVEQDPKEILLSQFDALQEVAGGIPPSAIRAIGITNQRETVIAWNPETGEPYAPAIVWQCRRSAKICERLREQGLEKIIREKTGLVLDPYFSGTKILWLLENIPDLKSKTAEGKVIFGTVDSWLLFHLTKETGKGKGAAGVLATEPSNASRTMLLSLESIDWDPELLNIFGLRRENLPEVKRSAGVFGQTKMLGPEIPITAILGDQQAALFGHRCFEKNSMKCTFGTGAFLLAQMGQERKRSTSGLIETIAWHVGERPLYALEGSIFVAGALIQWLRDKLEVLSDAAESESLAQSVADSGGVMLVPAFVGLGAPHWNEAARGMIIGLTRDSSRGHLVRAALEGVAHQVVDLLETPELMQVKSLQIDGGMSRNKVFAAILADLSGCKVEMSPYVEMTAFGVASLAGYGIGIWQDFLELSTAFRARPKEGGTQVVFNSVMSPEIRNEQRKRWKEAIRRCSDWNV